MPSDDDEHPRIPPDDVIPVALATTRPKKDLDAPHELGTFSFEDNKGRIVEVRASGFSYRGVLVGADEAELYLKTEMRWLVLPLDRVTSLRVIEEQHRPLGGPRDGEPE